MVHRTARERSDMTMILLAVTSTLIEIRNRRQKAISTTDIYSKYAYPLERAHIRAHSDLTLEGRDESRCTE
jgi:hypothetical protein